MTMQSDNRKLSKLCCSCCQPGMWILIGLTVVLMIGYGATGYLTSQLHPDSDGYIDFQWDLSEKGLNGVRTPGYPLFLQTTMKLLGIGAVPFIHNLCFFIAVIYFYQSLLAIGYRPFSALVVAVPLMLGLNPSLLAPNILTDSLALTLSLFCLGAFNFTWRPSASFKDWLVLTLLTFITYQVRPAYLFILVLWPLMGVWTTYFLSQHRGSLNNCIKPFLAYLAVSVVPFVMYTILRGLFTGFYGVVAFGGYNTIGIAVQFLDQETVEKLPEDMQDFGTAILKKIEDEKIRVDISSYNTMEPNYPDLVYQVSVPVATEMFGTDVRKINAAFNRLSMKTFQLHPKLYLRWLVGNWKHAVSDQANPTFRNMGTVLVILLSGLSICGSLWNGSRKPAYRLELPVADVKNIDSTNGLATEKTIAASTVKDSQAGNRRTESGRNPSNGSQANDGSAAPAIQSSSATILSNTKPSCCLSISRSLIGYASTAEFQYLFWLSTWYSLGKTSLVSLVEPTVGRYMAPASILWPSVIALIALQFTRSLRK